MTPTNPEAVERLIERLRSSAKAFRENTVYSSDGDPVRLGVQADECDQAADALSAANARVVELEAALKPFGDACTIASHPDDYVIDDTLAANKITFGDLRRARTLASDQPA